MKSYIALCLILFGFFTKAQQEILTDNTWYLKKVIIDGTEYAHPTTHPDIEGTAVFTDDSFLSIVCNWLASDILYTSNTTFIIYPSISLGSCNGRWDYDTFEHYYFGLFFGGDTANEVGPEYQYSLTEINNNVKELTLINTKGNKAIYHSDHLHTTNLSNAKLSISPNPVKDILYLQNLQKNAKNLWIEIYDTQGKLIINQFIKENKLDVSQLEKGIYFIKIKNNTEVILSQKIIKK